MLTFTKEHALKILEKSEYLIGQPFDTSCKITNIWIVPIDQDRNKILRLYKLKKVTSQDIAETYGKEQNLSVLVVSTQLLRISPIFPVSCIGQYLPKDVIAETLNNP